MSWMPSAPLFVCPISGESTTGLDHCRPGYPGGRTCTRNVFLESEPGFPNPFLKKKGFPNPVGTGPARPVPGPTGPSRFEI